MAGNRLTWVKNYSKENKATSAWHLLHSVRVREWGLERSRTDSFALTMCGYQFRNPRSRYELKLRSGSRYWNSNRRCDNCQTMYKALTESVEIPDELVIREDA